MALRGKDGRFVARRRSGTDESVVEAMVDAMLEKKGERVVGLDLRHVQGASFDFFVVCDAFSAPQVRAIADAIEETLYVRFGLQALHVEGYSHAEWVLLDYGGVVAHVFLEEVRRHYRLEELWGDARRQEYNDKEQI